MIRFGKKNIACLLVFTLMLAALNLLPGAPAAHAARSAFSVNSFEEFYPTSSAPSGTDEYDELPTLPGDAATVITNKWYKGYYDESGTIKGQARLFVKTAASAYKLGNVSLKLLKDTNGSVATVSVSTATYTNISGTFYARTQGSGNYTLMAQWSVDGGKTWNTAASFSAPELAAVDLRTVTTPFSFSITNSLAFDNANFMFRFLADKSNAGYINVDNFTLYGDPILPKPVTAMQLNTSSTSIGKNETLQMLVTDYSPAGATGLSVRWSSSDKQVANVDAITGLVTAKTPGTTLIRATNVATGVTKEAMITILSSDAVIPVTGITASPAEKKLVPGQTLQLEVGVTPSNATNKDVTWMSSDPSIASVSTTGLVTAWKLGAATVTATSVDQAVYKAESHISIIEETDEARSILSFGFTSLRATGTIDQNLKTITIKVPDGTDVRNLKAAFRAVGTSVYVGGTQQISEQTAVDFTNPVVYTVKGLSNSSTSYTVTLIKRTEPATSRTFYAASADDVVQASKKAQPGDTIVLKNGTWNDADIYFSGDGLPDKPITLKAEVQGQVILQGASRITVSGSYLVVDGFTFLGRSKNKLDGAVTLDLLSYQCRLTNTVFDNFNPIDQGYFIKNDMDPFGPTLDKQTWVWNYGTYNRIDHNTLIRKAFTGETMRLHRGIEHHAVIDHNYFAERALDDNNGTEAIQVGMYLSPNAWDTKPSYSVIENNLFYRWLGEIEIVSVKAHNTIFRYNTLRESRGTVTLRISDQSEIYGNFFLQNNYPNSGAIRVYGDGHKIYNNYISGTKGSGSDQRVGIALQAGVSVPGMDTQPVTNTIIAFNTIVDTEGYGIVLGATPSGTKTVGPNGLTLANNIIKAASGKLIYNRIAPTNAKIEGNIGYGTATDPIGDGVTSQNPMLVKSVSEEVYRPAIGSPAIGAAVGSYDFVIDDMDGHARLGLKDIGADQNSTATVLRAPLKETDVGPAAASHAKELTSFVLGGVSTWVTGDITGTAIHATVPYGTDVKSLVSTFKTTGNIVKINGAPQISAETVNDFSGLVVYTVIAADGSTMSYTVTVTAAERPSTNANLNGITVSAGTLSPAFSADVTEYTVTVPFSISKLDLTAVTAKPKAMVTINGTAIEQGAVYGPASLNVGFTAFTILVTSENGTTKTYNLNVRRLTNGNSSSSTPQSQSGGNPVTTNVSRQSGSPANRSFNVIAEVKQMDGKSMAVAMVDRVTIDKAIESEASSSLQLRVEPQLVLASGFSITLDNSALQSLNEKPSLQNLVIDTQIGSYQLPIQQLNLQRLSQILATTKDRVQLVIVISRNEKAEEQARSAGQKVLASVEFSVKVRTAEGITVELTDFKQYVPRALQTEQSIQVSRTAAVRVFEGADGSLNYEPVPFTGAGNEITIYSRTNSTYMLLDNDYSFQDMKAHWAKADVEWMANKKIVQGMAPEVFRPDDLITRAEFAALLTRTLGLGSKGVSKVSFTDVKPEQWYYNFIATAAEAGLITGYEDQTFKPNQKISRQEMAVLVNRAIQFADQSLQKEFAAPQIFTDQDHIENWAVEAVSSLTRQKLMEGVKDGMFAPQQQASRAQSAVLLKRMLEGIQFSK